eukprot:1504357-Pleurochrysis_carterae.AAC.1
MPSVPASTSTAYSALPTGAAGISRVALVDRGSTRTASGDRSLFPSNCITQRSPNMRVKVANGVTLP